MSFVSTRLVSVLCGRTVFAESEAVYLNDATHGIGHRLCRFQCYYAQTNGLQLSAHFDKLCYVVSRSNEILCLNFRRTLQRMTSKAMC